MLAENELNSELRSGRIFDITNANVANIKVQPSSIDLTVKLIHVPGKKKTKKSHEIHPGETVILEINEIFSLSSNISGIVFPKNTLSKNGIIMTNPGHVDPGYKGILTLYLVNMSKETFCLREKDSVARLLLFKTSSITTGYKGGLVTLVEEDQLTRMDKDFAGLNTRMKVEFRKILAKWSITLFVFAAILVAIVGMAVPIAFTLTSSYLDDTKDLKLSIKQQEEKIVSLNKEIALLHSRESKENATITEKSTK